MMKKTVLLLLLLSALLLTVACEKDAEKDDASDPSDSQQSDFVWPGSDENPIVLPEDSFE